MTNEGEISTPPEITVEGKPFSRIALAALVVAVAAAILGGIAVLGARWNLWPFLIAFTLVRWAAYGGIVATILGVIAIFQTRPGKPRRGFLAAVVATGLGLVVFGIPWQQSGMARSVPPIHDITTDTSNPPAFVAIAPLRADAPNPAAYDGPEVAAQQLEHYPDIRPIILDMSYDRTFQRALDAAESQGWRIVAADHDAGRIEATDRTFWFGFPEDIVIRVQALDGRSVLDIRSKSRVGSGDAGTNARRIRKYLEAVRP